jgi:hypothetical protein
MWADMEGRIHVFWDVSLDVWFPTCRRNVTSSLSGVSSPTTYQMRGHNIAEDLNFNQHLSENGPGSSFGIATDYGLDSPGSNPGGDEIFHLSRPALGSTQHPVKWVLGLSWG